MIQLVDITSNLKFQDQKSKNKILGTLNSTVSHELRNPLNCLKSLNQEKKKILNEMKEYLEKDEFSREDLIRNVKKVHERLTKNQQIEETSCTFMQFTV